MVNVRIGLQHVFHLGNLGRRRGKEEPSGKRISTINSRRDDSGKNCLGTYFISNRAPANNTIVSPTTNVRR